MIIISYVVQFLLNILFRSCRVKVYGEGNIINAINADKPILLCSWHGRMMFAIHYLRTHKIKIFAISSTHDDSETLSKILVRWKIGLIRGSSTSGWKNVIVTMMKKLKDPKTIIAITNDGPKGPPQIAKSGSLHMALKANATVLAMSGTATRFFELKTWDKFRLPKPFSIIHINISQPLEFPKDIEERDNDSKMLTEFMNTHQEETDRMLA